MAQYQPEQRWISDSEAELGLGTILAQDGRLLTVLYPATGDTRQYALRNAPLTRVRFAPGDEVTHFEGWKMTVREVEESEGLLVYHGLTAQNEQRTLPETQLSNFIQFRLASDRLFAGQIDPLPWFSLRYHTRTPQPTAPVLALGPRRRPRPADRPPVAHRPRSRRPHGAARPAGRRSGPGQDHRGRPDHPSPVALRPRRAGADPGPGKPPAPVAGGDAPALQPAGGPVRQGALRRKRCQQSLRGHPVGPGRPGVAEGRRTRPGRPVRRRLGPAGGRRSPPPGLAPGPGQRRIRAGRATGGDHSRRPVAHRDPGATRPGQPLRAPAPARSESFPRPRSVPPGEREQYRPVAEAVQELLDHGSLSAGARKAIHGFLGSEGDELLASVEGGDEEARSRLVRELLDRHGTGRVLFRNTRAAVQGFPSANCTPIRCRCRASTRNCRPANTRTCIRK